MILQKIIDFYNKLKSPTEEELASVAVEDELIKLSDVFKDHTAPDLPNLIKNDGHNAIWEIDIKGGEKCYMSAAKTPGYNDENFIVHVDTERFYSEWLRSSAENSGHCVIREEMPLDNKYKEAVEGFLYGTDNPVPLADALLYPNREGDGQILSLGGGITRSFWLIANQAESFPVHVNNQDVADELHKLVGIGNGPISFEDFFNQTL